jgi:hypothetical protein
VWALMLFALVGRSGLFLDLELGAAAPVQREDRFGLAEEMGEEEQEEEEQIGEEGLLSLELLLGPGAMRLAHSLPSPLQASC